MAQGDVFKVLGWMGRGIWIGRRIYPRLPPRQDLLYNFQGTIKKKTQFLCFMSCWEFQGVAIKYWIEGHTTWVLTKCTLPVAGVSEMEEKTVWAEPENPAGRSLACWEVEGVLGAGRVWQGSQDRSQENEEGHWELGVFIQWETYSYWGILSRELAQSGLEFICSCFCLLSVLVIK